MDLIPEVLLNKGHQRLVIKLVKMQLAGWPTCFWTGSGHLVQLITRRITRWQLTLVLTDRFSISGVAPRWMFGELYTKKDALHVFLASSLSIAWYVGDFNLRVGVLVRVSGQYSYSSKPVLPQLVDGTGSVRR